MTLIYESIIHWICLVLDDFDIWVSWKTPMYTTLCDKVCQWLATGQWFSPISFINKTDHRDITEILLKVALNTITLTSNLVLYIHISFFLITPFTSTPIRIAHIGHVYCRIRKKWWISDIIFVPTNNHFGLVVSEVKI